MERILELSSGPNSVFSERMIVKRFAPSQRHRSSVQLSLLMTWLRRRGLIVQLDNYPRYHFIGSILPVDLNNLDDIPVLNQNQQEVLQTLTFLAKASMNETRVSRALLVRKLHSSNRARCLPLIDQFLNIIDHFYVDGVLDITLNDILVRVFRNL